MDIYLEVAYAAFKVFFKEVDCFDIKMGYFFAFLADEVAVIVAFSRVDCFPIANVRVQ